MYSYINHYAVTKIVRTCMMIEETGQFEIKVTNVASTEAFRLKCLLGQFVSCVVFRSIWTISLGVFPFSFTSWFWDLNCSYIWISSRKFKTDSQGIFQQQHCHHTIHLTMTTSSLLYLPTDFLWLLATGDGDKIMRFCPSYHAVQLMKKVCAKSTW